MIEPKFTRFEMINSVTDPIYYPFEILMILWGKPELISIYLYIMILCRLRTSFILTQPQTAKVMGISYMYYLKKRKELEDLNLIKVERDKSSFVNIKIDNRRLWGLYANNRPLYCGTIDPIIFKTFKELSDFTENTGKNLTESLRKIPIKEGQADLLHNIYINKITNKDISNNIISNNNTNKVTGKTYPKEDYTIVLDAFKKYKGVGLMGPEVAYHCRAIKMMFQANRKPKEIIDFMKWLHDNERNEETSWVKTWTIWTVQKKMAEFVAGKLEVSIGKDDLERI